MRFAKAVVKYRIPILILALLLIIPSAFGMIGTRINYDMLDYLPSDMDTVIGQDVLMQEFGKGAFSFIRPDRKDQGCGSRGNGSLVQLARGYLHPH